MDLNFIKETETSYEVSVSHSGKVIGYLKMDIDGFFYFSSITANGAYWSENELLTIGLKLKELNKGMDEHITDNLK